MKITIDTRNDSREEIKKVIDALYSFLGESLTESDNSQSRLSSQTQDQSSRMDLPGIFGNSQKPAKVEPEVIGEVSGMFTENREEEVKIPEPKVVDKVEKSDNDYKIAPY